MKSAALISLVVYLTAALSVATEEVKELVLLLGSSQTGKSTFCNTAADDCNAEIGDGSGVAVSTKISIAWSDKLDIWVCDSPGFNDNRVKWTNQQVMEYIITAMVNDTDATSIKIVLTESLSDSTIQLQNNIKDLEFVFGPEIVSSIVVIGTKNPSKYQSTRIATVKELCDESQIPFVKVDTFGDSFLDEIDKLKHKLDRVKALPLSKVSEIRERIYQRAHELQQQAGPLCKTETVISEELEKYTEKYQADCQRNEQRRHCKKRFFKKKCKYYTVPVVYKCEKERELSRPIKVEKQVGVCTEREFGPFLEQAKQEWISERTKETQTLFKNEL